MNSAAFSDSTVFLAKARNYDATAAELVRSLLDSLDLPLSSGSRVLVKPNLLRADPLTCSSPLIVATCCRYLLDKGCRVSLGDSPGFGSMTGIMKSIGMDKALQEAGCGAVRLRPLDSPRDMPLTLGGHIGLSRHALDADLILNLPRLKAHSQMRVTCASKNLFGCISGMGKPLLHARLGDKLRRDIPAFPSAVADILGHLPPVASLLDAITAMHVRGPSGGKAYQGGLLAASRSPVALDTAIYSLLGVKPEAVPLWQESQRRKTPGALPEDLDIQGEPLTSFDFSDFVLPATLNQQSFEPSRLFVSMLKRLWARFKP